MNRKASPRPGWRFWPRGEPSGRRQVPKVSLVQATWFRTPSPASVPPWRPRRSSRRRPRRRPTIARLGAFRPRTSPRRRALRGAGHFTNGRSARPDGHLASSAGGPSFTNERRLAAFVRRSAAYDERPARRATNKQSYTIGTKPAPEHARRADAAPRRRAPTPRNEARRRPVYSGRVSLTV